jgi:hypothetical protein
MFVVTHVWDVERDRLLALKKGLWRDVKLVTAYVVRKNVYSKFIRRYAKAREYVIRVSKNLTQVGNVTSIYVGNARNR